MFQFQAQTNSKKHHFAGQNTQHIYKNKYTYYTLVLA